MGGYDSAWSDQNHNRTVRIGVGTTRELLLAITNICDGKRSLLDTGIGTYFDSAVSPIWLPPDVCARLEEIFGLTYNNPTYLYLVNDTLHEQSQRSNPNIIISLATTLPASASSRSLAINISLPYGAFDMVATYPLASSTDLTAISRYFPLR
jgi:hypothetical protein